MKNKLIKIVAILMTLCFCVSLAACGNDVDSDEGDTYYEMDYTKEKLDKYITLGQYKGLSVNAPRTVVTEGEIDAEIQSIVDQHTKYEPYDVHVTDRETVAGDFVNISYVGTMDGEVFEGGSSDSDSIVLAENNGYIDWFEDDLYGIMPGTTVTYTNKFPDDYYEELAGKEVSFEITLNYIAGHYTIPEVTDEFISGITGFESVAAYREHLRKLLQEEYDAEYELEKYQLMWAQVLENATVIELPERQVMYYYTSERSVYEVYAAENGYTYEELLEQVGITDEYMMEVMKDRVKEEIIFYSIVKAEGIEVTQEDYANGLIEYAAAQGMSESALVEEYGEEYIKECVLWDKLMYALAEQTTFVQ